MSDVMQRCVPVQSGTLSPDQRVNYQFGLVLGVDEFEQEDLYLRERDERAARVLHGSGTASGLHVTASRPPGAVADVEVRIAPGVAVDLFGRPIVVTSAQCARVGAWLAAREEAAAADEQASPLLEHLRPSGDLTLYVVAEYLSCPDALVPLPGNPCGSDDELTAPSRIRDSWTLDFRWAPPPSVHWDGVRALADLLLPIELSEGSLLETDEAVLAEYIRALVPGSPPPTTPLPAIPVLPRAGARAALDRLLLVWLTEVRPTLAPDLLKPDGDAAVLLSAITVMPAAPFDAAAPVVTDFLPPDDEGRPFLAPTQLVQELVSMGGGVATIIAGSPPDTVPPTPPAVPIELASLTEQVGADGARRLLLWSHLAAPLVLPASVDVARNGGSPTPFGVVAGPVPGTFQLTPSQGAIADGELLELRLELPRLRVREATTGVEVPLAEWMRERGLEVLGRRGTELTLHHTVSTTPEPPAPVAPRPLRQLVTASTFVSGERQPVIELWWHVDKATEADEERVVELPSGTVRLFAEIEDGATPVELEFEAVLLRHNVFQLRFNIDQWRDRGQGSPFFRVFVLLDQVVLENGETLARWGEALGVTWQDSHDEGRLLSLYVRAGFL